jgi:hypothetical protein
MLIYLLLLLFCPVDAALASFQSGHIRLTRLSQQSWLLAEKNPVELRGHGDTWFRTNPRRVFVGR